MPDLTSSAELEYITWKGITTHIVNKNCNKMLWVVLSWVEIGGLMRSISKARHPRTLYNLLRLQTLQSPYPRFPPRDTTITITLSSFFIKNRGWTTAGKVFVDHIAWSHPAGPGHFACDSLSVSFVSSSHVDVQVFTPSTALVISWTRDCRSSYLIRGKCYWALAMPQSPYPKPPQVWCHLNERNVSRSWFLEYVLKGGDSRWPLWRTTTKKKSQ